MQIKKLAVKKLSINNLELLLVAASFIPHPAAKALTRSAGAGLAFYKKYRRLKNLQAKLSTGKTLAK